MKLQFFDGYGYHGTSFEQTYRCYPASFIEKVGISSSSIDLVYYYALEMVVIFFIIELMRILC